MSELPRKTYFEDADARVVLENTDGQVFVHLAVKRWAPSVAKKLYAVQEYMKKELKRVGYKVMFVYSPFADKKFDKFVRMYQWKPLIEHRGKLIYFMELK